MEINEEQATWSTDEVWTRTIAAERAEDRVRALASIAADFERRHAAANPLPATSGSGHNLRQSITDPTTTPAALDFRETRPMRVDPPSEDRTLQSTSAPPATIALEAFGERLRVLVGLPPQGRRDRRAMREWETVEPEELARWAEDMEREGGERGSRYGDGFEAWVRSALREEREEREELVDAIQEYAWGRRARGRGEQFGDVMGGIRQ